MSAEHPDLEVVVQTGVQTEPSPSSFELGLFQDLRWGQVVEKSFGHEMILLTAISGGQPVGRLPLSHVTGPFFGSSFVSTAFSVGSGLAASSNEVATALLDAAIQQAEQRNVGMIEIRGSVPESSKWRTRSDAHVSFGRPLMDSDDEELARVPRKRRAEIRKGLKLLNEGTLQVSHAGDLDAFYQLYAHSLRNLGTPVFSRTFIKTLADAFADSIMITEVQRGGTPIVSILSFFEGDTVYPYYAGISSEARKLKAADLAYYSIMNEARRRGYSKFEFGRSKVGSPHAAYKKSWGFEASPVTYSFWCAPGKSLPERNPQSGKFLLLTKLWSRLPLPIANRLGPLIARELA
ncbi:MAG: FemAB family XrtA/PEP-CTERM system-associated protein [Pseudomonadota bacterium]